MSTISHKPKPPPHVRVWWLPITADLKDFKKCEVLVTGHVEFIEGKWISDIFSLETCRSLSPEWTGKEKKLAVKLSLILDAEERKQLEEEFLKNFKEKNGFV